MSSSSNRDGNRFLTNKILKTNKIFKNEQIFIVNYGVVQKKTNNKKTNWIFQKMIKTNFSNELEKNNSFFTEQTILLNERFSEPLFTEKTNDILRLNEFYDRKKRTKCIVHEQ